jgi:ABC-type sulfate transport system permease component
LPPFFAGLFERDVPEALINRVICTFFCIPSRVAGLCLLIARM